MAPSRRCGTLGDHDGHQRGEAADRVEPRRARQPCHAGFLGWNGPSPLVRRGGDRGAGAWAPLMIP